MTAPWLPERHSREAAARRKTDSPNGAPCPPENGAPGGGLSIPAGRHHPVPL